MSTLVAHADESSVEKGENALSSHLWEVAANHFQAALADKSLEPAQKARVGTLLAEAWLRDGKANQSLELLNQPYLAEQPETPFWTGQALAALGRFAEAVEALKPITLNKESANHDSAGFTAASLELALGKPEAALATLSNLADSKNPQLAALAKIRQTQILLDLKRVEEARALMPAIDTIAPNNQPLATLTEANILLQEKKYEAAEQRFRSLTEDPKNQTLNRYHKAVIGLADTLNAKGNAPEAADLLLTFIESNPESPQLEAIFKRLLETLPDTLTVTNPTLVKLAQWIPPNQIPATGLINTESISAISAWPTDTPSNDLQVFALFTRAQALKRINTPEATDEARSLLTRLRLENPTHFLSSRALLLQAKWDLTANNVDRAFSILQTISETATSPIIRGEAAFIQAKSAFDEGKQEQAMKLFDEAAQALTNLESDTAKFNSALIEITHALKPDDTADEIANPSLASELQLERALAIADPIDRRIAIEAFLIKHPSHKRAGEARLKVAEAALAVTDPDISLASAQIDTIKSDPEMAQSLKPVEIDLIQLRIYDLSDKPEITIESARKLLTDHPSSEAIEEASLILGRNLYQTGNYNDARITLEKLAATVDDKARSQAALLLAARSAALVPTIQSQQEALILFNKTIKLDGPVTSLAKLEKGRLMIDMGQLDEATLFLRDWHQSLADESPLKLPSGLMLGESIYAQGGVNPTSLTDALKLYDELLTTTQPHSAVYNRLQYMRGRALEQLPVNNDPTATRDKQAFIAYYSVLERSTPPEEWQYFELCGFRALSLLEKAQRWPAAIACANKIASFKGPRAKEAATRASQLQLKHMIWED